jgi:hypothetical protein
VCSEVYHKKASKSNQNLLENKNISGRLIVPKDAEAALVFRRMNHAE